MGGLEQCMKDIPTIFIDFSKKKYYDRPICRDNLEKPFTRT